MAPSSVQDSVESDGIEQYSQLRILLNDPHR